MLALTWLHLKMGRSWSSFLDYFVIRIFLDYQWFIHGWNWMAELLKILLRTNPLLFNNGSCYTCLTKNIISSKILIYVYCSLFRPTIFEIFPKVQKCFQKSCSFWPTRRSCIDFEASKDRCWNGWWSREVCILRFGKNGDGVFSHLWCLDAKVFAGRIQSSSSGFDREMEQEMLDLR